MGTPINHSTASRAVHILAREPGNGGTLGQIAHNLASHSSVSTTHVVPASTAISDELLPSGSLVARHDINGVDSIVVGREARALYPNSPDDFGPYESAAQDLTQALDSGELNTPAASVMLDHPKGWVMEARMEGLVSPPLSVWVPFVRPQSNWGPTFGPREGVERALENADLILFWSPEHRDLMLSQYGQIFRHVEGNSRTLRQNQWVPEDGPEIPASVRESFFSLILDTMQQSAVAQHTKAVPKNDSELWVGFDEAESRKLIDAKKPMYARRIAADANTVISSKVLVAERQHYLRGHFVSNKRRTGTEFRLETFLDDGSGKFITQVWHRANNNQYALLRSYTHQNPKGELSPFGLATYLTLNHLVVEAATFRRAAGKNSSVDEAGKIIAQKSRFHLGRWYHESDLPYLTGGFWTHRLGHEFFARSG